jgi:hypothetical protein
MLEDLLARSDLPAAGTSVSTLRRRTGQIDLVREDRRQFAGFSKKGGREIAHSQVPDPAFLLETKHLREAVFKGNRRVWPMNQQQIKVIGAQIIQAAFGLAPQIRWVEIIAPYL